MNSLESKLPTDTPRSYTENIQPIPPQPHRDGASGVTPNSNYRMKTETVRISIEEKDLDLTIDLPTDPEAPISQNPLLAYALRKATKTPWRLIGANMASEMAPPYRTLVLIDECLRQWRGFQKSPQDFVPFEMELTLFSSLERTASDG